MDRNPNEEILHIDERDRLDPSSPGDWVVYQHRENLVTKIVEPKSLMDRLCNSGHHPEERYRVNFAELQRMKIRKLQCTLVNIAVTMYDTEKEPEFDIQKPSSWEKTLGEYVQALQEYDYMVKSNERSRDPFIVTGEYYPDHYVLSESIPIEIRDKIQRKSGSFQKFEPSGRTHNTKQTSIVGTRRQNESMSQWKKFEQRLGVASIGGIFLLGPMWLMVLHSTLYTSLIATTLFVAAFGFIAAWFVQDTTDVLASTAAYAAVLVVFVGSTTNQGS